MHPTFFRRVSAPVNAVQEVNIRLFDRKVTAVWSLSTQNYQASQYAAETDASRILDIASRGGLFYGFYDPGSSANVVEIDLGTPQISYMQFWKYANDINDELLVPALVFPVASDPGTGQVFQKHVVVPLIKDILDSAVQPQPIPYEKAQ